MVQLNDHFTYKKLFKAVIPSVAMMVFISIYSIIDGLFVSNFVGTTAFAGLNLIYPVLMIVGAIGFMIGTGGSALVSKTLGEGNKELANKYFSMFIWMTFILGIIVSSVLIIFTPDIAILLGAEGEMIDYCVTYGRICLAFQTSFIVQNAFQAFFVTAEKPHLGLILSIISGCTNIVLDFLFIFVLKKDLIIKLGKPYFELIPMLKGCTNGLSELFTNISASIVSIIYNYQLMSLAGENGIASYGVILYAQFIFLAVYFGYSMGTAPIFGFNYGAKNTFELKNLFKKSLKVIGCSAIVLVLASELLARPISMFFVGYDKVLLDMTIRGFRIFAISFLICGFNIFSSSFFTALNNGLVSLLLSIGRTFIFQIIAVLLLPYYFGLDGIWLSIIMSEFLALLVTIFFFILMRKRYQYY